MIPVSHHKRFIVRQIFNNCFGLADLVEDPPCVCHVCVCVFVRPVCVRTCMHVCVLLVSVHPCVCGCVTCVRVSVQVCVWVCVCACVYGERCESETFQISDSLNANSSEILETLPPTEVR